MCFKSLYTEVIATDINTSCAHTANCVNPTRECVGNMSNSHKKDTSRINVDLGYGSVRVCKKSKKRSSSTSTTCGSTKINSCTSGGIYLKHLDSMILIDCAAATEDRTKTKDHADEGKKSSSQNSEEGKSGDSESYFWNNDVEVDSQPLPSMSA